jgi:hypothetical protein
MPEKRHIWAILVEIGHDCVDLSDVRASRQAYRIVKGGKKAV